MKRLLSLMMGLCLLTSMAATSQADLVSYYNFNSLSITTASAPGSGGVPTSISADQGSGTLSLSGWTGLVDDFAGSTINALSGDSAEESLSLVGNTGNDSFIQLSADLSDLMNPIITFATRGTSSGFSTGTWSWSIDGINFSNLAGNTATTSTTFALATADFTGVAALTNAATASFRYTLTGATSTSGNNRIDNLQINASAVPEPTSMLLASIAGVSGGVGAWRRRKAKKVALQA